METTSLVRRALITVCAIALAACSSSSGLPSDPPLVSPSTALASPGQTAQPTPSPLLSVSPSVSPARAVLDGEPWIAYQGGTGGPARVRLVRPDGTGDHELTPGDVPGEQFHPDWSHDGKRVAFAVDDTDGTRDIWAANVDGGDVRQLYDCEAPCGWTDAPAWSPDDKEIAFEHGFLVEQATGEGDSSVEVLDLATGTSRPVYDAAATEYVYTPRWSPDGRWIVFELDRFRLAATRCRDRPCVDTRDRGCDGSGGASPASPLGLVGDQPGLASRRGPDRLRGPDEGRARSRGYLHRGARRP